MKHAHASICFQGTYRPLHAEGETLESCVADLMRKTRCREMRGKIREALRDFARQRNAGIGIVSANHDGQGFGVLMLAELDEVAEVLGGGGVVAIVDAGDFKGAATVSAGDLVDGNAALGIAAGFGVDDPLTDFELISGACVGGHAGGLVSKKTAPPVKAGPCECRVDLSGVGRRVTPPLSGVVGGAGVQRTPTKTLDWVGGFGSLVSCWVGFDEFKGFFFFFFFFF